jgi:hypothetical protein
MSGDRSGGGSCSPIPPSGRRPDGGMGGGVTYERSRTARMAESKQSADVYDLVYAAERPELFSKSAAWRVAGPGAPVSVRADSTIDVPEPELAVVLNAAGAVAGYTIGNDMSSRSIEGQNPLYLPQAKTYLRAGRLAVPRGRVPRRRDPVDRHQPGPRAAVHPPGRRRGPHRHLRHRHPDQPRGPQGRSHPGCLIFAYCLLRVPN